MRDSIINIQKSSLDWLKTASTSKISSYIRSKQGSSTEVVEYFLERIQNTSKSVFITVTSERARIEARAADARLSAGCALSPLDGIPAAWKDLIDIKDTRRTVGSSLFQDVPVSESDAPVVQNAASAGLVMLGKVNLAEFAYSALGQNSHFGTPLNPNSSDEYAPGGSSCGSGVAVASGFVPLSIGSDTAGSIRIPASYCGVVGLKTSKGHISTEGCFPLSRTQDTLGPLAHNVDDCALIYKALKGKPNLQFKPQIPKNLTVVIPQGIVISDLSSAVINAFEASIDRLQGAGVLIKRVRLSALDKAAEMLNSLGSIVAAEAFFEHRALMDHNDATLIDQHIRARIEIGRQMSANDLISLQRQRAQGQKELAKELNGAYLAMPTTPDTAPPLSAFDNNSDAFKHHNLRANRNTSIGSFYDLPGLAIPNGRDTNRMPTSFLLSASTNKDVPLLEAGLAVEKLIRGEIN